MIISKYASKALACVGGFIGGVLFSSNSTGIGKHFYLALFLSKIQLPLRLISPPAQI